MSAAPELGKAKSIVSNLELIFLKLSLSICLTNPYEFLPPKTYKCSIITTPDALDLATFNSEKVIHISPFILYLSTTLSASLPDLPPNAKTNSLNCEGYYSDFCSTTQIPT